MTGGKENKNFDIYGMNVADEVKAHLPLVEKYCKLYDIEEYISYILAIIQVETGGNGNDVMQSSESLGLPPNTLQVEESIKQGCAYFAALLQTAKEKGCDIETSVQSYNYGGSFIAYIGTNGGSYSCELSERFAKEKANGIKVKYSNPIAIKRNGGWRYKYGNMFYYQLVSQYLVSSQFDDETVQIIMNEAIKYEGFPYVFGGSNPQTSFDCSSLITWCYGKAGINLPRTAQEQYDAVKHIAVSEARAGDLLFFHSTYASSNYITHVAIYVNESQMYHAGDPIGFADFTTPYYQKHIVCAGRINK